MDFKTNGKEDCGEDCEEFVDDDVDVDVAELCDCDIICDF